MLLTARSALRHLMVIPRIAPAPSSWRFDPTSALIGAALTLLLAWLAHRFRDALRLGWETVTDPFVQSYRRLQSSAEERHRERVARWARALTIPQGVVPLEAIFVKLLLAAPPPLPQNILIAEFM